MRSACLALAFIVCVFCVVLSVLLRVFRFFRCLCEPTFSSFFSLCVACVCVHTPRTRSSYYNADTADLEIGQEFEDAEAEGEAALELQRASYKGLDAADYGEEEEEDEGDVPAKAGRSQKGKGKNKSKAATAHGAALSAMKSDLEQIALGGAGEVKKICVFCLFSFVCLVRIPLLLHSVPSIASVRMPSCKDNFMEAFRVLV